MKKDLTPSELVLELDRYIIGQVQAKRKVAIAVRNRYRRSLLAEEMRDDVLPKNILMSGPTGVGKTEIARRLAKTLHAPFVKVEATKFTEVGYVGRDVESMIRDLMNNALSLVKEELQEEIEEQAQKASEDALLDALLPKDRKSNREEQEALRERFRKMLANGELDARQVEIKVSPKAPTIEIFPGSNSEDLNLDIGSMLGGFFKGQGKTRKVSVAQARKLLLQEQREKLIDNDKALEIARNRAQHQGIIFIDEIDKIIARKGYQGQDVSREGVQRDILPIVEGSIINSKHGSIDTKHILFIAAGAFGSSKPTDLIPELQGRFPLYVELEPLGVNDFERILVDPRNALTTQYAALLKTEGVKLHFEESAIRHLAELAYKMNEQQENIGARRLHTVIEQLLEDVSFNANEMAGQEVVIDRRYVEHYFKNMGQSYDHSRYLL